MAFLVTILLLFAGGGLAGLIFASPFLVCGIICFVFKKNVGLWCAWAVYVLFDIYMSYATGISRSTVLHTLQWTHHMNYMRLAFAWALVVSLLVMIAITVLRFCKHPYADKKKGQKQLITAWAVVALIQGITMIWYRSSVYQYILENIFTMDMIYRLIAIILSWSRIVGVTVALVTTVRFLRKEK